MRDNNGENGKRKKIIKNLKYGNKFNGINVQKKSKWIVNIFNVGLF